MFHLHTHKHPQAVHSHTHATHTDTHATHTDTQATCTDTQASCTDTQGTHTDTQGTHIHTHYMHIHSLTMMKRTGHMPAAASTPISAITKEINPAMRMRTPPEANSVPVRKAKFAVQLRKADTTTSFQSVQCWVWKLVAYEYTIEFRMS